MDSLVKMWAISGIVVIYIAAAGVAGVDGVFAGICTNAIIIVALGIKNGKTGNQTEGKTEG